MGQDELDLIKALAAAPVIDGGCPAMAGVAKAVDEDDGGRVPGHSRDKERRTTGEGSHFYVVRYRKFDVQWVNPGAPMAL